MLSCLCFLSLGVLWGIHFLGHESAVRPILQGPGSTGFYHVYMFH